MNTKLPVGRRLAAREDGSVCVHLRESAVDERGMALLAVVMVMMLCSVLMVGFVAAIVEDQNASGLNRDQTQAYAAAHAGLEKLTSDMTALFRRDVSPTMAQVNALVAPAMMPSIPGFTFVAPGGGVGYTAAPALGLDGNGNPRAEDPVNGSDITHGPFQGLRGIITPYDMTVTARTPGMAEVRLRRTLQTVAIPVFQFGMFSETNLAFHAGGDFTFGGRVHTNGHLFLAAGNWLRLGDRTTAVGEVIRWNLPNGVSATGGYGGRVEVIRGTNQYRDLARSEGSLKEDLGSAINEPKWTNLSVGTYNQYIRSGRTGVRRLDLPLVSDADGNGTPDGAPIDLIRRPPQGNVDPATLLAQRYYSLASLRILLSDTAADITNLPGIAAGAPVALSTGKAYAAGPPDPQRAPLAASNGPDEYPNDANGKLKAQVYRSDHDQPLIGGFIKIEMFRPNVMGGGAWEDVTNEILSFGIVGRSLADRNNAGITRWNDAASTAAETCPEPQPNAILRLQRLRDVPVDPAYRPCGLSGANVAQDWHDYWPMALYDTREGQWRDDLNDNEIRLGGVINYVELDVNNLRRWFTGGGGGLPGVGTNARNENGFIVYFSDRRNNRNNAGNETGEYGFEDFATPPNFNVANGGPNPDPGEDVNGNGTLDDYGRLPQNRPACNPLLPLMNGCNPAPFDDNARPWTVVPGATQSDKALVARANRIVHFRRALKLTNGGLGQLPMPGLTIVSENPVYIQGNYNATAGSVTDPGSAAAAVIADAVTLLSNDWNDIRSFMAPTDPDGRVASTTGYRVALVSGKGLAFPQPAFADDSFGSDGGVHNFMRLLESWTNRTIRYRGSLVSLFHNRQATGTFKCCQYAVYEPGTREWTFDTNFLLPPGLPPGTPMFRDVNTLTFRQLLRPTQ
jgi:hypothetical protein